MTRAAPRRARSWWRLGAAGLATAGLAAWALARGRRAVARYYATTPPPRAWFDEEERPAVTPIWREGLWTVDWLGLRLSPTYRAQGVARGDGAGVILVPGFLA